MFSSSMALLPDLVTPSSPRRFLLPEYLPYAGIFHERGQPGLATHSSVNRVLAGKNEPPHVNLNLLLSWFSLSGPPVAPLSSRRLHRRRSVGGGQQHRQHHLPPAVVGLHQVRPAGDQQRYRCAVISFFFLQMHATVIKTHRGSLKEKRHR